MRIMINDVAAQSGGALSILNDFETYMSTKSDQNEWIYLLSGNYVEEKNNVKVLKFPSVKRSWLNRLIFDLFGTRRVINAFMPDVYVSLQNVLPRGIKAKKILYVHQPIPFQTKKRFSFFKRDERIYAVYQYIIGAIIKKSIKRADDVIVQTDWMKKAVEKYIKKGVVYKIAPCVERIITSKKRIDYGKTCFFYPTSDSLYKNIGLIEKACKKLDEEKLLYSVYITVEKQNRNDTSPNIKYIGKITRDAVFERYMSSVLLFPSYIETFGYPLAEARECGSFIIASDCDFSHEVLAGYSNVLFFNPFSFEDLSGAMRKVICGYEKTDSPSIKNACNWNAVNGWEEFYKLIVDA